MHKVVVAEVFSYELLVQRIALEIDLEEIPLAVEKVFDLPALAIAGLQVAARVGEKQKLERMTQRPS